MTTKQRERPRTEELHYAACNDCDGYKWCDDEIDARNAAYDHERGYNHDAYHGSTEVEL